MHTYIQEEHRKSEQELVRLNAQLGDVENERARLLEHVTNSKDQQSGMVKVLEQAKKALEDKATVCMCSILCVLEFK